MAITCTKTVIIMCILALGAVRCQDDGDKLQSGDMATDELLSASTPTQTPVQVKEDPPPLTVLDETHKEGSGDTEHPIGPPISRSNLFGNVITVPKCDINRDENDDLRFNCADGYMTEFPKNVNSSLVILILQSNNFTELSSELIPADLPSLRKLIMASNQIRKIEKLAFEKLPKLERLDLASNYITKLDVETFSSLRSLKSLDLSGNQLVPLPKTTMFLNAPAIEKLSLGNCGLTAIPENAFDGMTKLSELNIGDNPINASTPITVGVFAALVNLTDVCLPAGVSDELIKEVCRTHALLEKLDVTPCNGLNKCPPQLMYNENVDENIPPEPAVITTIVDTVTEDFNNMVPETNITSEQMENKPPTVSQSGSNKTIIGLIVGAILLAVVAVVIKKNWGRITGRNREIEGNNTSMYAPKSAGPQIPEEVPLQNRSAA